MSKKEEATAGLATALCERERELHGKDVIASVAATLLFWLV
jgi:hypothetical protein